MRVQPINSMRVQPTGYTRIQILNYSLYQNIINSAARPTTAE